MKGEKLWLARKRDDPLRRIGWIWGQHFEQIGPATTPETKEHKHNDTPKTTTKSVRLSALIEKSGQETPDYFSREERYQLQPTLTNEGKEDKHIDTLMIATKEDAPWPLDEASERRIPRYFNRETTHESQSISVKEMKDEDADVPIVEKITLDNWIPQAKANGELLFFNIMTGESSRELPLDSASSSATENTPRNSMDANTSQITEHPPRMIAQGGTQNGDSK